MTPAAAPAHPAATTETRQVHPLSLWTWGLLASCLLLSADPYWFELHRVFPSPVEGALAPDWAWTPPAVRWASFQAVAEWPWWACAVAAGALIALGVRRMAAHSPWGALALGAGLCLAWAPRDILPAVWLAAMLWTLSTPRLSGWGRRGTAVAIAMGVAATSIEFGLVWMAAVSRESRDKSQQSGGWGRWRAWALRVVGVAAVVGASAVWAPGFLRALLRPVSWIWIRPDASLLPSCSPVFADDSGLAAEVLLTLALAEVWRRRLQGGGPALAPLVLLSVIGLGCVRYLAIAVWGAALLPVGGVSFAPQLWMRRAVLATALLWIGVQTAQHGNSFYSLLVSAPLPQRTVNPVEWGTSGKVLLLNLDQSDDWRTAALQARFELLATDRWDIYGDIYPRYAAVGRDLGEVRHESYLRSDGSWGGYLAATGEWSPTLLVADSRDLDRIRNLSLSPHWRLMGIDGRRTIFGNADAGRNSPQINRAMAALAQLEWPVSAQADPQVIASATAEDVHRVAGVMCAARLPYAALRWLRTNPPAADDPLWAWCYLELAHRARRYSGETSLLDQPRAVQLARGVLEQGSLDEAMRRRMETSLTGLGVEGDAIPQKIAQEARPSDSGSNPEEESENEPRPTTEEQVRAALARGNLQAANELLERLPESRRGFYSVLSGSTGSPPAELYGQLEESLKLSGFPVDLRAEGTFYLGCLAIEAGDAGTAGRWLEEHLQLSPSSPWASLTKYYLAQLKAR